MATAVYYVIADPSQMQAFQGFNTQPMYYFAPAQPQLREQQGAATATSTPPPGAFTVMQPGAMSFAAAPVHQGAAAPSYFAPAAAATMQMTPGSMAEGPKPQPRAEITCFACRGVGHKATQCPLHPRPVVPSASADVIVTCAIHGKPRTSKNMYYNNQVGVWQCFQETTCKNLNLQ